MTDHSYSCVEGRDGKPLPEPCEVYAYDDGVGVFRIPSEGGAYGKAALIKVANRRKAVDKMVLQWLSESVKRLRREEGELGQINYRSDSQ